MKKGRLSSEEKQYIINNKDKGPAVVAKELDRNIDVILEVINADRKEPPAPKGNAKELMGRRENQGIVVMTEAASQVGDEFRKNNIISRRDKVGPDTIHKIDPTK